ncbi:MAG: SDR family NAD(P)-dependent oxidoreductase [Pseudomonadota bacterium]
MAPLVGSPSFRLDGKRALITGAGRGIGRATAMTFAAAGAELVLASRTKAELDEVAAAIRVSGGRADTLALDVTDVPGTQTAIAALATVDVLVNNAGTARPATFADVTLDDFDAVMAVNLRGAFFCAQAVARQMIDRGTKGSIVNLSSQLGHVGAQDRSVYTASKFAIEGLTKSMAIDLAPHGIRVNSVCPTVIETPLAKRTLADPAWRAHVDAMIPLGRIGQVEDVTGPILFLASDAAALMTGSAVLVDGGWTAR